MIKGKVQGVFYRVNARKIAIKNNLTGWVKNTPGGDVLILTCGLQKDLDNFIEWCRNGPDHAIVTSLTVTPSEPLNVETFEIRKD